MRKLHIFHMNDSKRESQRKLGKKNRQLKVAQPMNPNLNYFKFDYTTLSKSE